MTDFSVIVCVYYKDNSQWFEDAVKSILNQTVRPNEVVLVVDGPVSAELESVVSSFEKEEGFRVIRLQNNLGHGGARRIGLQACKNDLVAIMDSDDISLSNRFEIQLAEFTKNPNADVVGGQIMEFVGSPDNVIGKRVVPLADEDIKGYLKKRCPMNFVTVMLRKASVERAGGFIDWYCEEDYYLWIRMFLADMLFVNVNDTLVKVRVGKDMYERRGGYKYFKSEKKLQDYMLEKRIIGRGTYCVNVLKRFIVQIALPNKLRSMAFKYFAREKSN